ncbi:hypothetical protein Droror1_Dr00005373 [Drosera rotundifolia]
MPIMILSLSPTAILPPLNPTRHRFPLHRPRSTPTPPLTPITTTTTTPTTPSSPVIIVGAGLAGLSAALELATNHIPFLLLESSDGVGGRVRTDSLDGFLLDRGFQIFITAYPTARRLLDYQALGLRKFYSGARVYYDGKFHNVADPTRHLLDSVGSLMNPIGTVLDKLLIGLTRIGVVGKSEEEIFLADEATVMERLRGIGFSGSIIDRFFRPFFGGIFFDRELETTSRLFEFIFKCLALGDNALPANGIGAIPEQLVGRLPPGSVRFNSRVVGIESVKSGGSSVVNLRLESGETMSTRKGVVVAVEEPEAERLLKGKLNPVPVKKKPGRGTVCLYYSAERGQIPTQDPILYLNGFGEGIVNNMFFPTNVAPSYGPSGKALVSVSLIGSWDDISDDDLRDRVIDELSGWFGESMVRSWKHLRTYRIRFAQPNQTPPTNFNKSTRAGLGVYLSGDYLTSATFDGALVSGQRAAEALLEDMSLVGAK